MPPPHGGEGARLHARQPARRQQGGGAVRMTHALAMPSPCPAPSAMGRKQFGEHFT
jgi:hypothetical protein